VGDSLVLGEEILEGVEEVEVEYYPKTPLDIHLQEEEGAITFQKLEK